MAMTFTNIDAMASQWMGQEVFEVTASDFATLVGLSNPNATLITADPSGQYLLYGAQVTNDTRRFVKIYSNGIYSDDPVDPGVVEGS